MLRHEVIVHHTSLIWELHLHFLLTHSGSEKLPLVKIKFLKFDNRWVQGRSAILNGDAREGCERSAAETAWQTALDRQQVMSVDLQQRVKVHHKWHGQGIWYSSVQPDFKNELRTTALVSRDGPDMVQDGWCGQKVKFSHLNIGLQLSATYDCQVLVTAKHADIQRALSQCQHCTAEGMVRVKIGARIHLQISVLQGARTYRLARGWKVETMSVTVEK